MEITHLMYFLVLLLTISLQLIASYIVSAFHLWLTSLQSYICSHTETIPMKFQGSGESGFCVSKTDYLLKIPKWQHKLVREYKRGKLIFYFLNNAAEAYKWTKNLREHSLHEKCPNTKLHLVRIFLHSD